MSHSDPGACQHCGGQHEADALHCTLTMEAMASPGLLGRQLDRYQVESLLGTGSFSAVYRARHVHTGMPVALKVLKKKLEASGDETVVERFLREARAAATVGSEHIVHVIDAGRSDDLTFLALEFLEGAPLDALVKRARLPIARAIELTSQVLDGLEATHRAGIIHRDMKPANVFVVNRDGRDFVKLLDFGISKIHADDVRALTMTGVAMGTPSYMAPEQFFDARSVDERADLYSVAVMLYELLSGKKPLVSSSYAEAVMKVRSEVPPMLSLAAPSVPKSLSDVVMKGLAKAPEDRWQSATEFKHALRGAIDDGSQKTFMRPQPPSEAKTILAAPGAAPGVIHPWQVATLVDGVLPAPIDAPRPPLTAPAESPEHAFAKTQARQAIEAKPAPIDAPRPPPAESPEQFAKTHARQAIEAKPAAPTEHPLDPTPAAEAAPNERASEPGRGSTAPEAGVPARSAGPEPAVPDAHSEEREPTIPPEAAAFLRPAVPRWVWLVVVVVVLGGILFAVLHESPSEQPPEKAPPAKLRDDDDVAPVDEPPPPPVAPTKKPAAPVKRRR